MLSKLLTLVLFVAVFGCENKKFEKSENSNISTVEHLNQGEYQQVIDLYSNKSVLEPRERHYYASALSQAGGIQVFSLYPVLEIQLFHKNALEWDELSADRNPYFKFFKTETPSNSTGDRQESGKREWEKNGERRARKKLRRLDKPSYQELKKEHEGTYYIFDTKEVYKQIDEDLELRMNKILELNLKNRIDNENEWHDELYDIYSSRPYPTYFIFEKLFDHYKDRLKYEHEKKRTLQPQLYDGDEIDGVRWEIMLATILWNTYEAVPVIRNLPELTSLQQDKITEASEEYVKLLDSDEFYESSLKSLGLLTGISIISYYKQSINLNEVNTIVDMFCRFDPKSLMDNYSMIRMRMVTMAKAYSKLKDKVKISDSLKNTIENMDKRLPEELPLAYQERYIQEVEERQESCYND